jgi:dihydrolipoamide dehydrogenase
MSEQYDVVIIGSGPGGYVAAIRCAQLGMKTACVEKRKELGGTCLNVGCIPSKALLHSSEFYWRIGREAKTHGIDVSAPHLNFTQMMARKQKIVASFNEGIAGLFKKNKITRYTGTGSLLNATTLSIAGEGAPQQITARNIILATGSEPIPLPFLPFDERRVLSSTGALALDAIPSKLLVIGAGIIGVELGSVYSRLGSQVSFIEFMDKICPTLDESLSKELQHLLTAQGMQFNLSSKVTSATISEKAIALQVALPSNQTQEMQADAVLVCIGRKPYTQGLGLEQAGISVTERGFVKIDGLFRTSQSNIYAIGDIVDGPMLAHKAEEEGIAAAEIIGGHRPKIEYAAIPSVVYTHPEVASVGMTEAEAKSAGLATKIGTFPFKANSRARCTGDDEGFVKMIAEAATSKIVGVHIIGAHASELIAEAAFAIHQRATIHDIAATPHAHPTLHEALKEAALAVDKRAIHK